jgi:MoaA/NifB/PqqE/SkfB family radical SAM enzyme
MNIKEKLEIAKQYISNNELTKALRILKRLICLKTDAFFKEQIYFEIGKIYMMLNENKKSTIYLSKISKKNSVYNFAVELLLKNYKILKMPDKQIDVINKNKDFPMTEQTMKDLLETVADSKDFVMCFNFLNRYRDKISNFDEILKKVCRNVIIHVQYLNRNHKYNETIKLFKSINRYVPETEKKFKNILLNEYEIAQNKIYLKSYPRIMNLVLTNRCNLRCTMCSEIEHNGEYNLSNEGVENLVEIMPYLEKLVLRGGEVFLHEKILYILEQAKKYKVDIEIVTNGLLLTGKIVNLLLDVLTEITFSIDSVNKETYEKIRVGASFEKLLENIDMFNNLNKERNCKVFTRLTMVVMRSNYKEIENIIKFASEHQFKEVYLLPVRGIQADRTELVFSHGFDRNIINELNNKKTCFENIAKQHSIKLYNMLPGKKTNFNDSLMNKDVMLQKKILKKNADKELTKLYNNLMNRSFKLQKFFLEDYLNIKINKKRKNNIKKYCFSPWKQIFLFDFDGMPTCICKQLFTKLNTGKKNFIMSIWNNKVMQYYRYKIINNEYKALCARGCPEDIKFL